MFIGSTEDGDFPGSWSGEVVEETMGGARSTVVVTESKNFTGGQPKEVRRQWKMVS